MNHSVEELERKRQALIAAETNSVTSQAPCESDSGGLSSSAYPQPYENEQHQMNVLLDPQNKTTAQKENLVGEAQLANASRAISNQGIKRPISVSFHSLSTSINAMQCNAMQ